MRDVEELKRAIDFCMTAHADMAVRHMTRKWDGETPYSVHCIWCAMTFLQETKLPLAVQSEAADCVAALLFHDYVEDTPFGFPPWLSRRAEELVRQMTFSGESGSTVFEIEEIFQRPPIVRLLKLYDKVSNLLDGSWMPDEKWNGQYVPYTLRLAADVEKNYGDLNIVRIARAVAIPRSVPIARAQ